MTSKSVLLNYIPDDQQRIVAGILIRAWLEEISFGYFDW